jgi:hypothetical protein
MIWFAWFILALEILVIALGLRIVWLMVWEAVRAPADPSSPSRHQPQHPPRRKVKPSSRREDEDYPALFALEEVDERGYVGSRKLHTGCEAAVCRTLSGPGSWRAGIIQENRSTPGTTRAFGWQRRPSSTPSSTLTQGKA